MAFLTQYYSNTLNDQNINTALLVGTITNSSRIRKLYINVFLDNVAGGATGDYYAYLTWQRAGAGNWYETIRTSKAAAVGAVSITFETIVLTVNATDVLKVYVLGLAGDNVNAVDCIVDCNEEWIDIDANGRVDVGEWLGTAPAALSASGYVQSMLLRWLTDNAAGTPSALSTGNLPADVKLWLATAPAAVTASGYLQAALLRWLTDNAAGTPLALSANLVQVADSAGTGTLLTRLSALRAGYLDILAGWTGTLRQALRALAAMAAGEASADLTGGASTYDNTTDSQEAIANTVVPGAPINLDTSVTEIHIT